MIVIRLTRFGRLNSPFYRIVAANKRSKREAKPVDTLGTWNPFKKDLKIDKKKFDDWVKKGAQISLGVSKLIK
jgi:small subunit ribosomal protein S16